MPQQATHRITTTILIAALYGLGVYISDIFLSLPGEVVPIWPPAGISFAAMMLYGPRALYGIVLGALFGNLLISPIPLEFLVFALLANTVGPYVASQIMRRLARTDPLAVRVRNTFGLLLAGLWLGVISASIGTFGLVASGRIFWDQYPNSWMLWWVGDFFGTLVCAPPMISLIMTIRRYRAGNARVIQAPYPEVLWWFVLFAALGGLAMWLSRISNQALALSNIPMAFFLWSALRFSPVYTYVSVSVTLLGLLITTGLGWSGLPIPQTPADTAVLMLFLSTMALLPQLVVAANFERLYFESKLIYRANHDRLTGLRNRNAFEEHASAVLAESKHTGEPLAMGYLDLDQFKVVNDTCGHLVGDNLIRQISTVLESNLRPGDIIARLGGDEFAVLFRNCPELEVTMRADTLRHQVEEFRFSWQNRVFAFTVSIGVVPLRTSASFTKQLSVADTACYKAKEQGRNRVKMVRPGDEEIMRHNHEVEWVVRINEALEKDRFRLYCQPIEAVAEVEERHSHFEVLLRMLDERGTILMPGTFIPAAERFHLMSKMDRWVVEHTLTWLEKHPAALSRTSMCSINLTGPSLSDEAFQTFLRESIRNHQVPPEKICFEITETAAIGDLSNANRFIKRMRREGCRFALDDFGSGLASFGYLKTLPVDFLKIDGAFVRDIAHAPIDLAMVKSINEVGHIMGKKTIAEFVESEEVRQELYKLGVDYVQGYMIGRPVPIEEFFGV